MTIIVSENSYINSLSQLLKLVRGKLGMNLREMFDFLQIPSSTYQAYETGRMRPKLDFYDICEDKLSIDLRMSEKKGALWYTDSGEKMNKIQKERALNHEADVYFNHSIQDMVYAQYRLKPAFRIMYPGIKPRSICVKTSIGFIICRRILKTGINKRNLSLLIMKQDGQELTGPFHREQSFVAIETRRIAIADIYTAFVISHVFTQDKLTDWIIE
jgi:transcriptional regulator with XRE-family HTH domain